MTMSSTELLDRLAPATTGSRAERGRAWLEEHGFPTSRLEAWRYTPVDEIVGALVGASPAAGSGVVRRTTVDELAGDHGRPRMVFVNGVFDAGVSDGESAMDGLWLGNRDRMREQASPRADEDQPADGFHALNWAAGHDVGAVIVSPGAQVDQPIHLVHLSAPGEVSTVSHPRAVVLAGPGSRLHLIESYVGLPGSSVTNAFTRIFVGDGAVVTYHRVQEETTSAIHVGRTAIEQGANSSVRATSVMTGGHIARSAIDVRLTG